MSPCIPSVREPGSPTPPTIDGQRLQAARLTHFLTQHGASLARKFFRWARTHGISRTNARDAIQTVLLKFALRIQEDRTTPAMFTAAWLFRCAMREAVRNHKRSATVRLHEPHAEVAPGTWEQNQQAARRDQLDAVAEALTQLSERDQAVLTLHQVNEQREDEIAELYGVAQGTVSRWLAGAHDRLRHRVVLILIRQGYSRDQLPT